MLRRAAATIAAALALSVCAAGAQAHDFWIQPDAFAPDVKKTVDLRLIIGHGDFRKEFPRDVTHVIAFQCYDPTGKMTDVPSGSPTKIDDKLWKTAGQFTIQQPGLHLFAYMSTWQPVTHTPEKFATYLEKEDLKEALALHKRRMAAYETPEAIERGLKAPTTIGEYFGRCPKALVAGAGNGTGRDRVVGLPLEIVAETNPLVNPADKPVSFRVLLKGKPYAKARLAAYRESKPDDIVEVRTDAQGRASLRLQTPGMWIVRCIHIEHVGKPRVDWESLWATLTFERKAPAKSAPK